MIKITEYKHECKESIEHEEISYSMEDWWFRDRIIKFCPYCGIGLKTELREFQNDK